MWHWKSRLIIILTVVALSGCRHPLEIVGEGDIRSSSGTRDCTLEQQPCANLISGDYKVTYTAVPREGWRFVRWERCGQQYPKCLFNVPASLVSLFTGQTVAPLQAVFEPGTAQYNVLLIISDDQAFDDYGFAGHPHLQTPSLDALAAQSVQFPQTYVSSTCRPTFANLLTGMPEHKHGVTYIDGPMLGSYTTVADRMMNAGYATYQIGKFWEGDPGLRGFSDHVPFDTLVGNLAIGRTSVQPFFELVNQGNSPWFAWFSPFMPHAPHTTPDQYTSLYSGLGLNNAEIQYYGMVSWFDAVVGQVLAGVPADTIVVYLADNGYVQSSLGGVSQSRSKGTQYENGIRTQLLIRHPNKPATIQYDLASDVDVTATILAMAQGVHSDLPGRDLFTAAPTPQQVFGSRSTLGISNPNSTLLWRWIRSDNWKLVDSAEGTDELYDLASDPGEAQNLINAPQWTSLLSDLRNGLETLWLQ